MKFLSVILDECITWITLDLIRTVKKKKKETAKNTGLLYRAKQLLSISSPNSIDFSYVHTYLTTQKLAGK